MNRALRVIACLALTGCYTYRLVPLARVQPKDQVRVTARDGRRAQLYDVTVANDTLRGVSVKERPVWRRGRDSIAVAVADVTKVEVRRLDAVRSVAGGVGGVMGIGLIIVVLECVLGPCDFTLAGPGG